MSERNYWDEESLQEYKRDLIRQRNALNPSVNKIHIKVLDEMIESLPNHYPTNPEETIHTYEEEQKETFKEKNSSALGVFGVVLYFIIRIVVAILPFVMIGGSFFLTLLLISINTFVPFASAVFWIWGLVCAIKGVQDIWAIMYYIAFALIWIPFFISTIVSMFSKE